MCLEDALNKVSTYSAVHSGPEPSLLKDALGLANDCTGSTGLYLIGSNLCQSALTSQGLEETLTAVGVQTAIGVLAVAAQRAVHYYVSPKNNNENNSDYSQEPEPMIPPNTDDDRYMPEN